MKVKTFKLLGRSFKVKLSCPNRMTAYTGYAVDGFFDPHKLEIHLSKELSAEDMKAVFLHEYYHAVFFIVGLDQVIAPELQEILCETLSNCYPLLEGIFSKTLSK